jgi:hypothetical protein
MNAVPTTAITHNKEMAREFLAALVPAATKFTLQFFGDARVTVCFPAGCGDAV